MMLLGNAGGVALMAIVWVVVRAMAVTKVEVLTVPGSMLRWSRGASDGHRITYVDCGAVW